MYTSTVLYIIYPLFYISTALCVRVSEGSDECEPLQMHAHTPTSRAAMLHEARMHR